MRFTREQQHPNNLDEVNFVPREWLFWVCHLGGWLLASIPQWFDSITEGGGTEALVSFFLRFLFTTPVLLFFRYLYIRNRWFLLYPIELFSLVLGYHLIAAIGIAYLLPYSISQNDIWFDFFQRELFTTSREFDEKFISFIFSYSLQIVWCFIYLLFRNYRFHQAYQNRENYFQHQIKDAKVNTLSTQISPHFLFNGLNNLCSLMDEDVEKSQAVLRAFSDLLRFSMEAQNYNKIPLGKELEFIDNYIAVSKLQFEKRLNYERHLDKACESCLIPPMIIHMLVENAIKHGVSQRKAPTNVVVSVQDKAYKLIIAVKNEGELHRFNDNGSSSIGLQNIHDRLSLFYSGKSSCKLSEQDGVVCAEIHIPKENMGG